jgi:hypothetical protein
VSAFIHDRFRGHAGFSAGNFGTAAGAINALNASSSSARRVWRVSRSIGAKPRLDGLEHGIRVVCDNSPIHLAWKR